MFFSDLTMDTPSRTHRERNKQVSQGSKATSTPRTSNTPAFSISPSISRISDNDHEPMEVDNDEAAAGSATSAEIQASDTDTITSGDAEVLLNRAKKLKWVGWWSALRPRNKDSLYYQVMTQPTEAESIVADLLRAYQQNEKVKAVMMILQFLVDISGYKKVSIESIYRFDKGNAKEVIGRLQADLLETELKESGKFLFMKNSKFEITVVAVISNFVKYLIYTSYDKNILFDSVFFGHLVEFVHCMAFSTEKSLRATGVIFALKTITAMVNKYQQLLTDIQELASDANNNSLGDLNEKKTFIENSIEFLYIIFEKNCVLQDKKCYSIKIKCAQEIVHWINVFPVDFIIKKRCLGPLTKLVKDQSEIVRYTALNTCEKLIASPSENVHAQLKKRIELLLKIISARFLDASLKISIKAINIFTEAINRYSESITQADKLSIIQIIYHENLPLAKAAGKFLVTYVQNTTRTEDHVLSTLTKVAFMKQEFAVRLPFFVESCIEYCDELQNWNLIIRLLFNEKIAEGNRKQVLSVFKESVKFTLTGLCSKNRLAREESPQPRSEHVLVAKSLVPRFAQLIYAYQTDAKCINQLIEILGFLNMNFCQLDTLNPYFTEIVELLTELFQYTNDKHIMEGICKVFSLFSQNFKQVQEVLEKIKTDHVACFLEDQNQLTSNPERNLLARLEKNSLKISLLFAKFDLSDILKWDDIFQVFDNNQSKVLKHLISNCCKSHLIWSFRRFVQAADENNGVNIRLYDNCKEFVYGCLDMLRHSDNLNSSILIFETICDFYIKFGEELKRKWQFAHFIVEISDPVASEVLMKFVVTHVVMKSKLPLIERRKYLSSVVDMIFLKAVSLECLRPILECYHTHYKEFGEILDNILKQLLANTPGLPVLIIHTLVTLYKEILEKRGILNISSEEALGLKRLSKKFAASKSMKSQFDCLKLVNMGMFFAFDNVANYSFLYFIRYFADVLNNEMKIEGYNNFKKLVPDKDKTNEMVLLFAKSLKPVA